MTFYETVGFDVGANHEADVVVIRTAFPAGICFLDCEEQSKPQNFAGAKDSVNFIVWVSSTDEHGSVGRSKWHILFIGRLGAPLKLP